MQTPKQLAKALGDIGQGDAVLAQLIATPSSPELVAAIRASFKRTDEQGNHRRLRALAALDDPDAVVELLTAVLIDEVETGGIYSNLRNGALEIIVERFLGDPRLRAPLMRAIEIDEYLTGEWLGLALAPYEPQRGFELLVESLAWAAKPAIEALAELPGGRAKLLEGLAAALPDPMWGPTFLANLGPLAEADDVLAVVLANADSSPTAAVYAAQRDPSRVEALADRLTDRDPAWRSAAIQAYALLDPAAAFDRAAPLFTDPARTKGAAKARLEAFAWEVAALTDPRWVPLLSERLASEDNNKARGLLVKALGKAGPAALRAILDAPRDDKDKDVLYEIPMAVSRVGGGAATRAVIEAAIVTATGKRKKVLVQALGWISD